MVHAWVLQHEFIDESDEAMPPARPLSLPLQLPLSFPLPLTVGSGPGLAPAPLPSEWRRPLRCVAASQADAHEIGLRILCRLVCADRPGWGECVRRWWNLRALLVDASAGDVEAEDQSSRWRSALVAALSD